MNFLPHLVYARSLARVISRVESTFFINIKNNIQLLFIFL